MKRAWVWATRRIGRIVCLVGAYASLAMMEEVEGSATVAVGFMPAAAGLYAISVFRTDR